MEIEIAELCRLCTADLSEVGECYQIENVVKELVNNLVGIEVDENDEKPQNMCTDCFLTLQQFNDIKSSWLENQSRFDIKFEPTEDEGDAENDVDELMKYDDLEEDVEEYLDAAEDSQDQFESEIIDEQLDFDGVEEQETTSDEKQETSDDKPEEATVNTNPPTNKRKKTKVKRNVGDKAEKGKELYQKLLKKCAECSKMIERNRMEGHMNRHRDIRPFACDQDSCGKKFYCKLLLRLHQKSIHTDERIVCEICNKTFPSERSLYSHNMRHKNQNRYKCNFCDKKFNNTNSLKRHLAVHSGIREFSCSLCPSQFYRKFNLDVHIRTVHNKEKSYSCGLCSKDFGYHRLLKEHIKKSHEDSFELAEYTEC